MAIMTACAATVVLVREIYRDDVHQPSDRRAGGVVTTKLRRYAQYIYPGRDSEIKVVSFHDSKFILEECKTLLMTHCKIEAVQSIRTRGHLFTE